MFTPIRNLSKVVLIVILLITALFISKGLSQEHYPNNPITMVVPWSAGLQDIMTRAICKVAEKELGQPIIVENKPGANAAIGTNYVLKSIPDGYTLGTNGAATLAINPHLQKFPFNVLTDVIAISGFCKYNHLVPPHNQQKHRPIQHQWYQERNIVYIALFCTSNIGSKAL